MTHILKCNPGPFIEFKRGKRTHDIRKDDRGFKEGDRILYRDYDPAAQEETGEAFMVTVTCVSKGGQYGIPPGFVVMSVTPVPTPIHVKGDLEEERRRRDAQGTTEL